MRTVARQSNKGIPNVQAVTKQLTKCGAHFFSDNWAVGFVDLEKACDTVPREMVTATVRWMRVPEAEAKDGGSNV